MADENWVLPETPEKLGQRWATFSVTEGFPPGVEIPKEALKKTFIDKESLALRTVYRKQLIALGVIATLALRQYDTTGGYKVALQYFEAMLLEDTYQLTLFFKGQPNALFLQNLIDNNKGDADTFKTLLKLLVDFGQWLV